jgi:hypothetical protein
MDDHHIINIRKLKKKITLCPTNLFFSTKLCTYPKSLQKNVLKGIFYHIFCLLKKLTKLGGQINLKNYHFFYLNFKVQPCFELKKFFGQVVENFHHLMLNSSWMFTYVATLEI